MLYKCQVKVVICFSFNIHSIYVEASIICVNDDCSTKAIIKILHRYGIGKTVHKARKLFYWSELNNEIASFIKQCRTCEKYTPTNLKEALITHPVPKLRFNKISADV